MTSVKKYLFETSFEDPEKDLADLDDSPEQLDPMLVPRYSQREFDESREATIAEGHRAGMNDALQQIENRAADSLQRIGQALLLLGDAQATANQEICRQSIEVALAVTRKMIPGFAREGALAEVESVVKASLDQVLDEPRIVVRVDEELIGPLSERMNALTTANGFAGQAVLIGDPALDESDCRVEWADGGIERDTDRLWREIDTAIERGLAEMARARTAADSSPDEGAPPETKPEIKIEGDSVPDNPGEDTHGG